MAEPAHFELNPNEIPWATSGMDAPAFYAEYIRGALVTPTVAKIYLVENRVEVSTSEVKTIHVAQVIIPSEQLRAWGTFFMAQADLVDDMKEKALAEAVEAKATGEADGGA